jgi:uncharacterized membrane protein
MNIRSLIVNACFAGNILLLFLAFFGTKMNIPVFLQVAGRMHPLVLHFPIVLLILAAIWEFFVKSNGQTLERKIGDGLLLSSAFFAVIAALMGLFLSKGEGYDANTLFLHQWSGVTVSVVAWIWFSFREQIRAKQAFTKLISLLSLVGIFYAGHEGATITHGENFLFAPLSPTLPKTAAVSMENGLVYADMVQPILKEKCWQCHNDTKTKGDLNMTTEALLVKGGKNGSIWNNSAPQFGRLLLRVHLPMEAEEHMPPKGKAKLTPQEIDILYHWIKNGASFTQKIADLSETDTLRMIAKNLTKSSESEVFTFAAADESTIKKLNNDYRVIYPLAMHSPALAVDFYGMAAFKSEFLKELQVINEQLVYLNLQKMPIKDEDLKTIANFPNLQNLNLTATQITGKSLQDLSSLKNLQQLSLSSTEVQLADLQLLSNFSKLKKLFLWNTTMTDNDNLKLQKILPNVYIETGYSGDSLVLKINAPLIESKETIFDNQIKVCIKNYIKGAETRYTLDGSIPDSIASSLFKSGDSLLIDKTCTLNTKSFKAGWLSSDLSGQNFYRVNIIPDSVSLTYLPHQYYPGEGKKTLVDKKIGDTEYMNSKKWLGYDSRFLETFLFFKQPQDLTSVTISTLVHIVGYIMPAQEVEIWGGNSLKNLFLLKKIKPIQPIAYGLPPTLTPIHIDFPKQSISVLKVVAKPVGKLPLWHEAKGKPAWLFVDEIFIN